jgi:uncharacterized short protein YbdD (DUF466 family)
MKPRRPGGYKSRACAVLKRCWQALRQVSGDDAYERYLAHWQASHAGAHSGEGGSPMNRKEFFRAEQERKWNGVRRCC